MKKGILVILALGFFSLLQAQQEWSLQACIDHALANNIEIKQQELNTAYQENLLKQNKGSRLPNLNASVSQSFGFGRSLDLDNTYVNSTSSNTGFSLNSSVVLWQGGVLNQSIKKQEFDLKSSVADLEKAKDDITINIAQSYLEILFADEIIGALNAQLEQTLLQIERTEKLVKAGKVAEGTLLEIKAQAAREKLELVNAENNRKIKRLNLVQLLELDNYTDFNIARPVLPEILAEHHLISARAVFDAALSIRPEIKSAEYQVESSHAQLQIAKAGRLPSLTASASLYDQYYTSSTRSNIDFNQQMVDNYRSSLALSLSIPIFNRFENKYNIQNAEIQIESSKLSLESTKKELRQQIEQAYFNALASFESYNANKVAVASMSESFRYMTQKFELGRVNSVEYNDAKTNLAKAQSDLIQAKYEFIFRSKILDFYNGVPIVL